MDKDALASKGEIILEEHIPLIEAVNIEEVKIRSVIEGIEFAFS